LQLTKGIITLRQRCRKCLYLTVEFCYTRSFLQAYLCIILKYIQVVSHIC
jgi:hypothetical protein